MIVKNKFYLVLGVAVFFIFSCDGLPGAKDEDDEEDKEEIGQTDDLPTGFGKLALDTGINTIPNVVDPVLLADTPDAETQEFNTGTLAIEGYELASETGISLDTDTTLDDFSGKSYAACELVNRMRGMFFFAAEPDFLNCELSYILGESDEYYDGNYHVIEIKELEDGELLKLRFKFKIEGTKDKVTGIKLHMCENGVQDSFVDKTIADDGTITINSKMSAKPENSDVDSFVGKVKVTGKVDSDQKYVGLKTIESVYSNSFSNGSVSYVKERLVQSASNMFYTGYDSESNHAEKKYAGFFKLIDKNTSDAPFSIKNYYLGDGALAFEDDGQAAVVQGWVGDTKSIDNTLDVVARVVPLKTELPATPASKEVLGFEGEEIYDCGGEPDLVLDGEDVFELAQKLRLTSDEGDFNEEDENGVCSGFYLPQEGHLECSNGPDKTTVAD